MLLPPTEPMRELPHVTTDREVQGTVIMHLGVNSTGLEGEKERERDGWMDDSVRRVREKGEKKKEGKYIYRTL